MVGLVSSLVAGTILGFLGIKCLRGIDWIFISGWILMPKEDKQKFRAQHDMLAMNRLIGKQVFLPTAAFCMLTGIYIFIYTQFDPAWMQSQWVVFPISAAVVGLLVSVFSALLKVLGTQFEITNNERKASFD